MMSVLDLISIAEVSYLPFIKMIAGPLAYGENVFSLGKL